MSRNWYCQRPRGRFMPPMQHEEAEVRVEEVAGEHEEDRGERVEEERREVEPQLLPRRSASDAHARGAPGSHQAEEDLLEVERLLRAARGSTSRARCIASPTARAASSSPAPSRTKPPSAARRRAPRPAAPRERRPRPSSARPVDADDARAGGARAARRSSPGVPSPTSRPRAMTITRSQSASTSERMWLEKRTVRVAAEAAHQLADLDDLPRVEADRRLVEDEDRRDRRRAPGRARRAGGSPSTASRRGGAPRPRARTPRAPPPPRAARSRARHALQPRDEAQVPVDAQVGVEGRVLREVADGAPARERLAQRVVAGDPHRAAGGREDAGQDAHRGRLAGAVRPEEADDLAARDPEGDAAHRVDARRSAWQRSRTSIIGGAGSSAREPERARASSGVSSSRLREPAAAAAEVVVEVRSFGTAIAAHPGGERRRARRAPCPRPRRTRPARRPSAAAAAR